MTKPSEAARRIRALRDSLRMPRQEDLAQAVGVAVTAVSAWERAGEKGTYEPSAENYLRLAKLAARNGLITEACWCVEQAELDEKTLLLIAGQLLEAKPSEMVAALLRDLPEKTRWFSIDDKSPSGVFAPGDVVVLDETHKDVHNLQNQIVLAKLTRPDPGRMKWSQERWPNGLFAGRLRVKQYRLADPFYWLAALGPFNDIETSWGGSGESAYVIASFQFRPPITEEEAKLQAPEKMILDDGAEILGRVIAWFGGSGGENKL